MNAYVLKVDSMAKGQEQDMLIGSNPLAVLYSFRRCPYAMRARLAIAYSQVAVELREVVLRSKPEEMLQISPKGTVPVLQTQSGEVIDQSLDIMHWAVGQYDPEQWLCPRLHHQIDALINLNDHDFKGCLDRYKYPDRHPEHAQAFYREQGERFLQQLEQLLTVHRYLLADRPCLADMAIMPFIRQFAAVDQAWFDQANYPKLQAWLVHLLGLPLFDYVMTKYAPWQSGERGVLFLQGSSASSLH
jgi:glutathione S-transferase